MKSIKVLVVDDSAFMRKLLTDFINDDPNLHVVGAARNGRDALNKVKKWNPDVVTLDVELPDMGGLDVLKQLMLDNPIPVVMVSSLTQSGAHTTFEAMNIGAIDFVAKPSGVISLDLHKIKDELILKIKAAANANVKRLHNNGQQIVPEMRHIKSNIQGLSRLVCIGSSTGGPRALQTVIQGLPKDLQSPVFIVQHLPAPFTTTLAERLDAMSKNHVKEAENGEIIQNGLIYLAPGGFHMKVKPKGSSLVINLEDSQAVHGVKPAFDVLLKSLADIGGLELVIAVLTGMGSDGADGLLAVQQHSHVHAIAESEESAVIFGMPKAAIQTGVVNSILPLDQIALAIVNQLKE